MEYDNRNIVLAELIGLKVRVIGSSDMHAKGAYGSVIDETKNTLVIKGRKGRKALIKPGSLFRFYTPSGSFIVRGEEINFRPYERIEKGMKYYRKRHT